VAEILVIDDNVDLLETVRQILTARGGHQVSVSSDAEEGLARALANPPDLAIVDVMMPRISGYEICRQLRADPRTATIPIIIFTARGQPVDRQAAMESGADDYMAKPVPMQELLDRVDDWLGKQAAEKTYVLAGTIVLLSLRGGVGVTTLAVNLATTLAQTRDGTACLVDLCPSSGHVALQLGLRPEPNWSNFFQNSVPSAEAIEAHLLKHDSGLHVLASPIFPIVGHGLTQPRVAAILNALRQRFTAIVVDAPSVLDGATMAALEAATVAGMVITAEAPSIQTAVGTLRALGDWEKFRLILNQIVPAAQLSTGMIERALKRPILGAVPFDPAQAQALAQRKPLALQGPASPLAQAVRGLAEKRV